MQNTKHRPFADGKFRGLIDSLQNSPYPLWFTSIWPIFFFKPSIVRYTKKFKALRQFKNTRNIQGDVSKVKLVLTGDLMLLNGDIPPVLSPKVKAFFSDCDIFLTNIESPVGHHNSDPSKRYTFKFDMPFDFLVSIRDQLNIDFSRWVVTIANNHSYDAGAQRFSETYSLLTQAGLNVTGYDSLSTKVNINNISIGAFGWTEWMNIEKLSKCKDVTKYFSYNEINNYKKNNSLDFMIAMPHWGFEFQHFPISAVRKKARKILDSDFDLILGSHPHVLQPNEMINNKFCFYSLGNFCGLGVAWPVKIISFVEVILVKNHKETVLEEFRVVNFFQDHRADGTVHICAFDESKGDQFNKNKIEKRLETIFG